MATCAVIALVAQSAHAQAPAPSAGGAKSDATNAPAASPADDLQTQAAARKKAGDEAMEALRYTDALTAYGDAYAITKDPALLYNMGRALQALDRFPEALEKLTAFEAAASPELKARVPRLPALIREIQQRVSKLTVHTNVDGARVLVRGAVAGKTPIDKPLQLVSGPAEIEIEADGYYPAKKSVELPGGGELSITLDLFSKSTTGILGVKASANGAEVLVDDKRIGIAPVELNVPKGTHKVTVRHRDFRLYETTVVVSAGGTKTIVATLESASILTRWWFWSAIGAAVTAGVVAGIAATTERAPDVGTIAPGQMPASRWSTGARAGTQAPSLTTGPFPALHVDPVIVRF